MASHLDDMRRAADSAHKRSIVIADPHAIFRQGLRALIEDYADLSVIGEASSNKDVLTIVRALKPDILLLASANPDYLRVIRQLQHSTSETKIILLTTDLPDVDLLQAIQLGVRGVVRRDAALEVLLAAVKNIDKNNYWLSRECIDAVVSALEPLVGRNTARANKYGLTARENDVLECAVAGCSNTEIAQKLSISPLTVIHHLSHIFEKLSVRSRLELAMLATGHRGARRTIPSEQLV